MKYHIIVLSCLLWIKLTECFQWDNSVSDSSVYANNSGSAIIKFRYSYGAEDRSSVNITCGIWNTDQTKIIPMVTKIGNQPAQRRSGVTGDVLGNNAALYTESTQPTVIGLRLSNIAKTFPTQYRCDASFTKADGVADSVLSERVILNVLERPKFTNCLQNIQSKETVAGNSLDITCKVSGNPTPNLKCSLLAFDREILNTFPKKNSGRNLEEDEPGMPSNITASFSNLPKEARFVRCFASQTFTGTNTLERRFTILHTPFPPKNFRQENSPDRTSITVSWLPLTDDEWGGAKDGYRVAYYMVGQDPRLNLTTKELGHQPSEFGQDANVYVSRKVGEKDVEFYFYTIKGLNPQRPYQVYLYAQNRYGKGDDSIRFSMTPGDNPNAMESRNPESDSKLAEIIGGVIGGTIVLVLIVILVVWLCRRPSAPKKSKYPTSYVEDAVDYPPQQPQQNLYAGVNNSKQRNGSSNHSDIMSNGDGYPMRGMNSYETSEKAYV
uniref:Fibronectin type-III domain-containing protein n=1 Tax=Clytia hemisphaerica TaxID=252671 RepID=A0A7M5V7G1_9CNID